MLIGERGGLLVGLAAIKSGSYEEVEDVIVITTQILKPAVIVVITHLLK